MFLQEELCRVDFIDRYLLFIFEPIEGKGWGDNLVPWSNGGWDTSFTVSDIVSFLFEFIVSMFFAIQFKFISGSIGPFKFLHLTIADGAIHRKAFNPIILLTKFS